MTRIAFSLLLVTRIVLLSACTPLLAQPAPNQANTAYAEKFLIWMENNRDQTTGLPYSHVGDDRFRHWTMTYDAAASALAYSAAGRYPDARKILDYYIETPQLWRLGGIVEACIAGAVPDVKDWAVRTGANIWMGLAGLHLYSKVPDPRYLKFVEKIADFALSLQNTDKKDPNNYGGIALGPKGDPAFDNDQYIGYDAKNPEFHNIYATEVTIDGYALFQQLYQVTRQPKYQSAASLCLTWLKLNGWNKDQHRFNRGYNDLTVATDVQSWGISALGVKDLDSIEYGAAEKMAGFVETYCLLETSFKFGKKEIHLRGVDFIDKWQAGTLGRKRMVSFEWTFQLVNAYSRLVSDFTALGQSEKAATYRQKRDALISSLLQAAIPGSGGLAYPYATLPDAEIGHEYRTPADGNLSVIGAAWAILALEGADPLMTRGGT